ncbi:hypothetical protein FIBSPDRAFT_969747 [Athelia psychrophila]|uniref:F-box domain-containing protein n=1 Tax=Athelia psychrophila TaxID=1759441 RepID=A0A167T7R9_9AGAM|nr:hypothetical protein FIBSPDRAFT_969747 [Fibularhizoctonia sp. CBS 109695]
MHIDVGSTNAMPILASCLKRSGKLHLYITLRVSAEYPDEDEMEQKALSLVLEHLHRWRHISIIWQGHCFNPNFTAGNAFSAPMLETLHFETQVIDDPSLDYQASSEIEPPLDLCLPWAQLVDLDLSCFLSVEQCIRILKECARVETCRLPLLRIYSEMDPNADIPTSLDNLRTLHINSDLPLDAFFDSFAFPALSIISISNSPNEYEEHREFAAPDWTQPSFLNLLQRSKAPLEFLRLAVTMSESDLIECLTCVGGTLQVLSVESVDRIPFLPGEAARFMAHHIDAGVVTCTCPKLE